MVDARTESRAQGHKAKDVATYWPNGHFFSPVVDPDERVERYWTDELKTQPDQIQGIPLNLQTMMEFWRKHSAYLLTNTFPDEPNGTTRYHGANGSFPVGDAVFVGAMMREYRPKRIIEIGSGSSTACMLDWAERLAMDDLQLTCIEPYPARLRAMLRPGDKVNLIEGLVQDAELCRFQELKRNDVLFIDSTHVLKTGSDVHFELFHILPVLESGVIIHFHDCAYPFEYPKQAVFDMNFSWNEAYAVRAFLMYNSAFKVLFWNSMFYRFCPPDMRATFASLSANPGGGLWTRKE